MTDWIRACVTWKTHSHVLENGGVEGRPVQAALGRGQPSGMGEKELVAQRPKGRPAQEETPRPEQGWGQQSGWRAKAEPGCGDLGWGSDRSGAWFYGH